MKRYLISILMISVAVGLFAADYGNEVKAYTFTSEELPYTPEVSIQVEPSDDIIEVFKNNDDDNLFNDAEEFLHINAPRNTMSKAIVEYIEEIITADTDDIKDLVNDELKAAMNEKGADEAYMILGNIKFVLRKDYK